MLPRAKLGEYKGLEVGRREPQVDPASIDEQLEQLRDRFATLETVERPAQNGDRVVVDYLGKIGDQPFEGGEGRDQLVELGAGRLVPGFEEQLLGTSAGEQSIVELTFPAEYPGDLGGKEATFEVSVSEVKAKRLPELDDEFASQAGGFDTLSELREDIVARLQEADARSIDQEFAEAVLGAAGAQAELELPDQLVHARAHEMLERTLSALTRQGISKDAYLRITGKDEETLAHEAEPEAANALRREAVLSAVVDAEQIQPSDEELLEALRPTAQRDGTEPEELIEQLRKSGRLEGLREDVANRLALELLVREATPITVEQASAREKLWTPGKDEPEGGPGQIWTPGG